MLGQLRPHIQKPQALGVSAGPGPILPHGLLHSLPLSVAICSERMPDSEKCEGLLGLVDRYSRASKVNCLKGIIMLLLLKT